MNYKETIAVSACLRGVKCRWHGKVVHSRSADKIVASFGPNVRVIEVCPEMLGGLPCPRPPVKRRNGCVYETCKDKSERKNVTGRDVTDSFTRGAEAVLDICKHENVKNCVFCAMSPSCGETGITTRLLRDNGINVINSF